MSTVCRRPQGGGGPGPCGQREGGKKPDFFGGRHKWMAPNKDMLVSNPLNRTTPLFVM